MKRKSARIGGEGICIRTKEKKPMGSMGKFAGSVDRAGGWVEEGGVMRKMAASSS